MSEKGRSERIKHLLARNGRLAEVPRGSQLAIIEKKEMPSVQCLQTCCVSLSFAYFEMGFVSRNRYFHAVYREPLLSVQTAHIVFIRYVVKLCTYCRKDSIKNMRIPVWWLDKKIWWKHMHAHARAHTEYNFCIRRIFFIYAIFPIQENSMYLCVSQTVC